jgi:hypothetical protein
MFVELVYGAMNYSGCGGKVFGVTIEIVAPPGFKGLWKKG